MRYKKAIVTILILVLILTTRIIPVASKGGMWREFFITAAYLVITGAGVALLIAPRAKKE
jgi:hypothetical protein